MQPKPWYQSRTIILNALWLAGTVVAAVLPPDFMPDPAARDWATKIALALPFVVNIGLRLVTRQPIGDPAKGDV